ncbi:MAG: murein biosynthesis integral membrane protein MurJ [Mycobacterium sp.]|nr:murein biosynthesis integral membrane protein MurJ [Mycobacterium sp.]
MTPPHADTDSRPAREELSDSAVVSRSWGMALATLVSRITGFIRIVLLAALLGAALSSAFTVANQLPNLIAALVLEATFTAIFVPVLARAERDDPDGGEAFVRRLVTLATTLLLLATVVSVAAAPLLVRLMLGGDPKVNQPLTTAFAYLLLPQVIFYGLTSVFMAILNNRNVFGPPAWAPVLNNVVAIATLGLYLLVPGELSVDPVRMGNAKLLVLGIGTTLGVAAQAAVLLIAIRRERISLRPLWGIDDRLKRFGTMAAAMVLYVLISQVGLVVGNQIASTAAASGPAIYAYAWLVLQLPFGMIGVTILTVVMPRLSRNAAAADNPAVLADLSLATRLTMVTLIPVVAFMTVAGPAIGSALFAYGKFGEVDANYLGVAIALSSFTLIPYALVLLQLRVFYARDDPWTPILMIVAITTVKILASLAAPHLTDDPELVAGYLGTANGIGFIAGAALGHLLLRRSLRPPAGRLLDPAVRRTILVTAAAGALAAAIAAGADRLLGLYNLTDRHGGAGSMVRLAILAAVMAPVLAAVTVAGRVPDALDARAAVARRIRRRAVPDPAAPPDSQLPRKQVGVTYSDPEAHVADPMRKGPELSDQVTPAGPPGDATAKIPRPPADAFQPDVAGRPAEQSDRTAERPAGALPLGPGATVANGRYRLLVFHGGPAGLQFWQALDTALDRQVALAFIDPARTMSAEWIEQILTRTQQLSRVQQAGVARVLDVTPVDNGGGLVVAEWIRGGSLKEVAATSPSAVGGARAIQSLAAAAEEAHRAGVPLSVDHPSRIRVSIDGDVALAFPATLPEATPGDDVRGIGAALYALLVDRWPLAETGTPSGLRPAETEPSGQPVEPRALNNAIPFQISAAAVRALEPGGGISSAPTLLHLLQQATGAVDRTQRVERASQAEAPPAAPPAVGSVAVHQPPPPGPAPARPREADPAAQAQRRRNLMIGIGVGTAILAVALIVLGTFLSRLFGDADGGLEGEQLGLNTPTASAVESVGRMVEPVAATVFSPGGEADAPNQAGLAIDGNPATAWPTDTYTDAVPFPAFKSGVGLMLQLPEPIVVGNVTVGLSSTGTQVEIRSATSPTPASLEDTTLLTGPTLLKPGTNTIAVPSAAPTSNVLVWVSTLGQVGGQSRTDISEITVRAAGS